MIEIIFLAFGALTIALPFVLLFWICGEGK